MTEQLNGTGGQLNVLRWGAATDIGKVRLENQDAFAAEPEAGLFLVIDGMGGHRGGRQAARMVAQDLPPAIELGIDRLRTCSARSIREKLKRVFAAKVKKERVKVDKPA